MRRLPCSKTKLRAMAAQEPTQKGYRWACCGSRWPCSTWWGGKLAMIAAIHGGAEPCGCMRTRTTGLSGLAAVDRKLEGECPQDFFHLKKCTAVRDDVCGSVRVR